MTDIVDSLPPRPLEVADYEALNASSTPVTVFPVSWYDEELVFSMVVFLTRGSDSRPVVVAYDESDEQWVVVDEPDPDMGFDEIDKILRPWFEERYETIPEELAVAPPDYDVDL